MKKIEINPFDIDSVKEAIKELNKQKQKYRKLEREVCYEIAKVGVEVAQPLYDEWAAEWENAPVTVEAVKTETGASLLANGESVCFLEFGSGTAANGKTVGGVTFTPGSWSASESGKQVFSTRGYWHYNDWKFTYIPPANALDQAIAVMREKTQEIIDRVMKEART